MKSEAKVPKSNSSGQAQIRGNLPAPPMQMFFLSFVFFRFRVSSSLALVKERAFDHSLAIFSLSSLLLPHLPSLPPSLSPSPLPSHPTNPFPITITPPSFPASFPPSLPPSPALLPLRHHLQRMFLPTSLPPSSLPSCSPPPVRIVVLCLLLPLAGRHGHSGISGGDARAWFVLSEIGGGGGREGE